MKAPKMSFVKCEGLKAENYGKVWTSAPITGIARVAYVDEEDETALVEFLDKDKELHDGNVHGRGIPFVRQHHGWWVPIDSINPIRVEFEVYRDGREMVCVPGASDKVGRAKCAEGESFDPCIGAVIAMARAYGKEPTAVCMDTLKVLSAVPDEEKPKLEIVNKYGESYGIVGKPTKFKDSRGVALRVGDEVLISDTMGNIGKTCSNWVVETKEDGAFIMGIHAACDGKTGSIRPYWNITLNSVFKERVAGEDKDNYLFVKRIEDVKQQAKANHKNEKVKR